MIQLHRLRTAEDPIFEKAMALYTESFPEHERRLSASQRRIMSWDAYHFDLIYNEGIFAGLALCWDAGEWIYVEHLCIVPEFRGRGVGTQALQCLCERGKTVILEIDPPADDISRRRQGFYERAGFCVNPYPHVHPAYRKEYSGHKLVIMSSPRLLKAAEYAGFAEYLSDVVMKDCQEP